MKSSLKEFRTWIELDRAALRSNVRAILKLLPSGTRFMAVVKSNAYGHGLMHIASALERLPEFAGRGWFGVDSVVEATRLREEGISTPILVLGLTLPARLSEAAAQNIAVSTSSFENLAALQKLKVRPQFHLKIDTGMHRQGFFPADLPKVIKVLKRAKLVPAGMYTHFAVAKDKTYPSFTMMQVGRFKEAFGKMERAGFKDMLGHASASGGTLLFPEARFDMVRAGIMIYGYYPSYESMLQMSDTVKLKPVLSWRAVVGEVKTISKGSYIGYDLTEKVSRSTKVAIIPVGYWHGVDRGLSSVGEVIIRGMRRKFLGRVSMDMIAVDVTAGKSAVRYGDTATLIGKDGKEEIWVDEMGEKIGTSAYEVLTRVNPLIRKILV